MAQLGCSSKMTCRIVASSGMRMRATPSLKSKVVTSVPKDSLVRACTDKFGSMRYEDINGFWRKVSYKNKVGFMFDGFLEIVEIDSPPVVKVIPTPSTLADSLHNASTDSLIASHTINTTTKGEIINPVNTAAEKEISYNLLTEAYNYCGDVQSIDPGLLWYGIYPKDEKENGNSYRIKSVEVNVLLSKQKLGKGLEFDIQTTEDERSIFLIGLNSPLAAAKGAEIYDNSEILRFNNRKVYPGQQWRLTQEGEAGIFLSATGSVETAGPCPDLENYKLVLKGEKYFLPVEQDITKELVVNGQCGMPEIYWYGDLNGDSVPEIIFVSVYDEKNQFTLFVSDPKLDNVLVRKETEWIISNCD